MAPCSRRTRRGCSAERRRLFVTGVVVPALLLVAAVQCAPDRVVGPDTVASVTVAPDSATLRAAGDTAWFSATARNAAGDTVPDVTFAWASSDASVARVGTTGLVTAVGTGTAAITATAPGGAADSAWVVVLPAIPSLVTVSPAGVSLSGVGASATLGAEYRNAQGQVVTGKTFTWASLNPAVATVSAAGVATAVAPGQAVIRAVADSVSGYALATVAVDDTAAVRIFAPMVSGTTTTLNGIWGTSATNVYAVGNGGTILHYDGSNWAPMASGTTSDLNAVWGTSATDVFAVGAAGTILHCDGSHWSSMASGSAASLNDVWGTSPVEVYAVGGRLLRWNGTTWSPADSLSTQPHRAVWGTSRSDIFVGVEWTYFSTAGTLLHSDGSQWSPVTGQVSVFDVWGASSFAVFAVGSEWVFQGRDNYTPVPFAMRWDGTVSSRSRLSGGTPRRVWGTGPANVYAVGAQGSIYRWNGATWSDGNAGSGGTLNGVWGSGAADVFAVGAGGTILRSVPGGTAAVTPADASASAFGGTVQLSATVRDRAGSPVTGVGFVWASSDTSVAVTNGSGLVTARRAGTATITATAQGGASASATVTVFPAVAVTPAGASLAGVGASATLQAVCGASSGSCAATVTWASLNPAVATVDGAGLVTAVAAGQVTISATANGTTAYGLVTVAVPEAAAVTNWTRMVSDTTRNYRGVWGASATDVYTTDSNYGGLWHYDGSSWSPVSIGVYGDGRYTSLVGVWGASASNVFVVGFKDGYDGTMTFWLRAELVLRWNGSAWAWMWVSTTFPGSGSFSVWGASPRDVFVSRILNQRVLVFDGQQWAETACQGAPQDCAGSGMWGTSARNVYAASSAGTILRYDGSAWSPMAVGTTQYLNAFWGASATGVFAVGAAGTILHFDGSTWSPMVSGTTQALNAVWGASATNVYAVGNGGTILHYDGATWSPMTSGTTATLYAIWGTTPTTVFVVGAKGTILQGTP